MEGAVIGAGLILLGCVAIYLGIAKLRDYRSEQNEFGAIDVTGLHPLWEKVFKVQRFNGHLDIWMFLILGPACVIGGIVALLR